MKELNWQNAGNTLGGIHGAAVDRAIDGNIVHVRVTMADGVEHFEEFDCRFYRQKLEEFAGWSDEADAAFLDYLYRSCVPLDDSED